MDAAEVFAVAASTAAVLVAALSLGISAWVAWRDRAHLRLEANFLLPTDPKQTIMVGMYVRNDGGKVEVVDSVGIERRYGTVWWRPTQRGHHLQFWEPRLWPGGPPPLRIESGGSAFAIISAVELHRAWKGQAGPPFLYASCASGRRYWDQASAELERFLLRGELKSTGGAFVRFAELDAKGPLPEHQSPPTQTT